MKCSRCGGEIPDNSGYCNLCGAKQRGEKEKLIKKPQLKTFAQCLVESEEGPKGRAKDPIKMNTLNGYGDKSPIKKKMQAKKVLIICVVSFLFIALVACVMDYFSQSPFESMAIQHAKELKRMLKDPDSMMIGNILCISVLIENSSGELETQVFTYIEYNAKNGYGAYAGTQIDYFDHGKYMGDVYDEDRYNELVETATDYNEQAKIYQNSKDEIYEEMTSFVTARLYLAEYNLYGQEFEENGLNEERKHISVTYISAREAARKVGCKPIK